MWPPRYFDPRMVRIDALDPHVHGIKNGLRDTNKVSHVVQSHGIVLRRYHCFVCLCIYCMPSRIPRAPHSVNKYTYLPSYLPPLPAPTPLRPSTTRPRVYDVPEDVACLVPRPPHHPPRGCYRHTIDCRGCRMSVDTHVICRVYD
jgi:hypothetical protein